MYIKTKYGKNLWYMDGMDVRESELIALLWTFANNGENVCIRVISVNVHYFNIHNFYSL